MRYSLLTAAVVAALAMTGCSKKADDAANKAADDKTTAPAANGDNASAPSENAAKFKGKEGVAMQLSGSGASFPNPVYQKWAQDYKASTDGEVNYQSCGSSCGIKAIKAKTVVFGASDAPMKPEELEANGLIQFPTVIGGVVPVVNIEGVKPGQLVLDGVTLAKIYKGDIKKWNNPEIAALNQGVTLPDANIATVHRSDGSGTTFNFTDYLNKAAPAVWGAIGANKTVKWPTDSMGTGVGGKKNDGVSAMVQRTKNSIGYVEYAYVKKENLTFVSLKNAAGKVVKPSADSFKAAGDVEWTSFPGFYKVITNSEVETAWPISAATFILVHKNPEKPEQVAGALNFFDWAYTDGDNAALALDYVPFSDNAVASFKAEWNKVVGTDGKPVYKQ